MRTIRNTKGTYIIGAVLLIIFAIFLAITSGVNSLIDDKKSVSSLDVLAIVIAISISLAIITTSIYFTNLSFYEDKRNGINYLLISKPTSKKALFFSTYFSILIPTLIIAAALNLLSLIFLFATISVNKILILYVAIGMFLSSILLCFLMCAFSLFLATIVSSRIFVFLPFLPLIASLVAFGSTPLAFRSDFTEGNFGSMIARKNIDHWMLMPTKQKNGVLDLDLYKAHYDYSNKLKNIETIREQYAYNDQRDQFFQTKPYEAKQTHKFSYFSWMSLIDHVRWVNNLFLKERLDSNQYSLFYRREYAINENYKMDEINKNDLEKYINFRAPNLNNQVKDYIVAQKRVSDAKSFHLRLRSKKQQIINALDKTQDTANRDKLLHSLNWLNKITNYLDIFNSKEWKELLSKATNLISSLPFGTYQGDFIKTYEAIYEKISNLFLETNYLNKLITAQHSLALYLCALYYNQNKDNLKKIGLPSITNKPSENEKALIKKFSDPNPGNIGIDIAASSLVNYSLVEYGHDTIAKIKSIKKIWNGYYSILFAISLTALFLVLGSFTYSKRFLK